MNWSGYTQFSIKALNQERLFNQMSQKCRITNLHRISKNESVFMVEFGKSKDIKKFLVSNGVEILSQSSIGIVPGLLKILSSYGVLSAICVFAILFCLQYQYVWCYQVFGVSTIHQEEIVSFVKTNFSNTKGKIDTHDVEVALGERFYQISFVSCIIDGQTLVLNIKEKLLPDEFLGQFRPIFAQNNAKITKIELISGTAVVNVGDFVEKGSVLIEPYIIDTSGQKRDVKASAKIYAEIYNEGSVEHFERRVETYKTGKSNATSWVSLFGIVLYSNDKAPAYKSFEKVEEETDFSNNNLLPLKFHKITYYETAERVVESVFEDVKEEYIQKSREKALENVTKDDKIINEYYTIRNLDSVTMVNYCIVTSGLIGG